MAVTRTDPRQIAPGIDQTDDPDQAVARAGRGERVIVSGPNGQPIALVVPLADLQRLELADRVRAEAVAQLMAIGERFKDCDPEEVEREALKAVAEVRAEMYAERLARGE